MLAAIVDALGVPVTAGRMLNFEAEDGRPSVGDSLKDWIAKAEAWNKRADVWGFKDTIVWRHSIKDVHSVLRNPYYIVAARDPVAVMQRRAANHETTEPQHVSSVFSFVLDQQAALWSWVLALPPAPLLVVSYERAISKVPCQRGQLVADISNFLELAPTVEQLRLAISRISQTGGYLIKDSDDA